MLCPKCQGEVPQGAIECPHCSIIIAKFKPPSMAQRTPPRPLSSRYEDRSEGKLKLPDSPWLKIAIVIVLLYVGYQGFAFFKRQRAQSAARDQLQEMVQSSVAGPVYIYGPTTHPATYLAQSALDLRGLRYEVTPVNNLNDLQQLDIWERVQEAKMKKNNIAGWTLQLPIFDLNGQLLGPEEFHKALKAIPVVHLQRKPEPYIIVYGPKNCGITKGKMAELDKRQLPYEFQDVNDPPTYGKMAALILATDAPQKGSFPYVEVNGYISPNPSLEEIEKRFNENK